MASKRLIYTGYCLLWLTTLLYALEGYPCGALPRAYFKATSPCPRPSDQANYSQYLGHNTALIIHTFHPPTGGMGWSSRSIKYIRKDTLVLHNQREVSLWPTFSISPIFLHGQVRLPLRLGIAEDDPPPLLFS